MVVDDVPSPLSLTCWLVRCVALCLSWTEIETPGGIFYVNEANPKTAGLMSKFGFSGDQRRSILITNNPGVTGVTGDGWVMALNKGAPKDMTVRVTQVCSVLHVVLCCVCMCMFVLALCAC
jgi:hypothetical protein